MNIKGIAILGLFILLTSFEAAFTLPLVNIIPAPQGSLVPEVLMGNDGTLHMVYVKNENGYYVKSTDNGKTFSVPVKINSSGTVIYKMGERGPKLSLGKDNVIHIAWMDQWYSGIDVYTRYTRSTDGGKTFEKLKTISSTPGVDGVSIASDMSNHVVILWHTLVPDKSPVAQATWLHIAKSSDNGVTFSKDSNISISNHSGLACSMCATRARYGGDGYFYFAFRSAENQIRDFYVLKGDTAGINWEAVRVNNDNWKIDYCPMNGPALEVGKGNQLYCAFMSSNHAYWSVYDTQTKAFSLHIQTPLHENDEIYPMAISNNNGQVLMVWQVGPMSTWDSATVKWASYDNNGNIINSGIVGRTFSGTKATAFTGTDDNFYIIANIDKVTEVISSNPIMDNNIVVTPNPANDYIDIKVPVGVQLALPNKIEIYSIEGMLMQSTSPQPSPFLERAIQLRLDVSGLVPGVYFVKVGDRVLRFVKI